MSLELVGVFFMFFKRFFVDCLFFQCSVVLYTSITSVVSYLYTVPTSQEQVGKLLTETQQRCGLARSDPELCSNAWIEYFTSLLFPFGHLGSNIFFSIRRFGAYFVQHTGWGKKGMFFSFDTIYVYFSVLAMHRRRNPSHSVCGTSTLLGPDQFFKFSFFCAVFCGGLLSSVGYVKWILRCALLVRRIRKYRFFCSSGSRAAMWPAVAVAEGWFVARSVRSPSELPAHISFVVAWLKTTNYIPTTVYPSVRSVFQPRDATSKSHPKRPFHLQDPDNLEWFVDWVSNHQATTASKNVNHKYYQTFGAWKMQAWWFGVFPASSMSPYAFR